MANLQKCDLAGNQHALDCTCGYSADPPVSSNPKTYREALLQRLWAWQASTLDLAAKRTMAEAAALIEELLRGPAVETSACQTCEGWKQALDQEVREVTLLRAVVQAVVDWNTKYPSSRIYGETDIRRIAAEMDAIFAKAREALKSSPEETSERPCTCHPSDNPPVPCPRKYALSECRKAAAERERINAVALECAQASAVVRSSEKALPARFECTCLPSGRETCRAGGPPFWTMCKTCGGAVNGEASQS